MAEATRAAFFEADGDQFIPCGIARSPWNPAHIGGVPIAGLLALLVEERQSDPPLAVSRLTIDILGAAPFAPCTGRVTTRRDGSRQRVIEAELLVEGRVVARASALLLREADSPATPSPLRWPLPETLDVAPGSSLRPYLERKIVYGSQREPGAGALWVRLDVDLVAGRPLSPLCRAAMFADFGSGIGSSLPIADWTFANVDIALHLVRPPRGDWLLIEADSDSAGNGVSLISSTFADRDGIYGHGHQTLFVEPRR